MSGLDKFYEKGFDVVEKQARRKRSDADVALTIAKGKDLTVNFGLLASTLAISKMKFNSKDLCIYITPVIQPSSRRLYFVEDLEGYKLCRSSKDQQRLWSNSKSLYEKFVRKYGFSKVVDGKLKWDNDLQAYYVEVQ
jgi:hypothetical protein